MENRGRRESDGLVPVRAGSHQDHEGAEPEGGRIVNNGSISAHTPRPNSVPYTATKHAITGLTKCIALDGRKNDIACGQLDIGNADTAMGGRMKAGVPQAQREIRPEAVFDVEHCGSAIRYMASLPLDTNVLFMTSRRPRCRSRDAGEPGEAGRRLSIAKRAAKIAAPDQAAPFWETKSLGGYVAGGVGIALRRLRPVLPAQLEHEDTGTSILRGSPASCSISARAAAATTPSASGCADCVGDQTG